MMLIQHAEGEENITSSAVLHRVLSKRVYPDNANHYWICDRERPFPALSVHVKGDLAHLNFIPSEEDPGLVSSGNQCQLPEGLVSFPSTGDPIEVPSSTVVSWPTALAAIEQYCRDFSLSDSVEWLRL